MYFVYNVSWKQQYMNVLVIDNSRTFNNHAASIERGGSCTLKQRQIEKQIVQEIDTYNPNKIQ